MAQANRRIWMLADRPTIPIGKAEKQAIIAACETFIDRRLKLRFLPQICPTDFNYCIDITGAYAGGRYRFLQRYRSGMDHNFGDEFSAPFARLDRTEPGRFDLQWMRHTGKWWPLHAGLSLAQALRTIEDDELLHPL